MVRSMWSGVQGLYIHQQEMDVIGNNISNVNTTSFKAQQTTFSDLLYQTTQRAYGAAGTKSGVNAKQVGLGAMTSSIMTAISKQGSIQTTDAPFDMSISGDSFFQVEDGDNVLYTRDGSFAVDEDGYLVTRAEGRYVLGTVYAGDEPDQMGRIQVMPVDLDDPAKPIQKYPGEATTLATIEGIVSRYDPTLSEKSGRTIDLEVYGSDAELYTIRFKLTDAGDDDEMTYKLEAVGIYDNKGKLMTEEAVDEEGNTVISNVLPDTTNVDLVFNPANGVLVTANGRTDGTVDFNGTGAASVIGPLTIDFGGLTNYAPSNAGVSKSSEIKSYKGWLNFDTGEVEGTGFPDGEMNGVSVGNDGTITRLYSNGQTEFAGQIVVAQFANASGLEKTGTNLYRMTANSGEARTMFVDEDGGRITPGTLEMSNVDLANEFTNMITAQRGFQANSKIITTSDEMIQIVRDLKR